MASIPPPGRSNRPTPRRPSDQRRLSGQLRYTAIPQLHPLRPWHRRTPNGEEASVSASEGGGLGTLHQVLAALPRRANTFTPGAVSYFHDGNVRHALLIYLLAPPAVVASQVLCNRRLPGAV